MELSDCISEEQICMSLEEVDRDKVIYELLDKLVDCGRLDESKREPAFVSIFEREELGSTAIGRSVAVPHARVEGLQEIQMAVGMSKKGVDFQALDGKPVKAIFLVIGPDSEPDRYIEIMKTVSQLVQTKDFRNFLFQSEEPQDIVGLLEEMDG